MIKILVIKGVVVEFQMQGCKSGPAVILEDAEGDEKKQYAIPAEELFQRDLNIPDPQIWDRFIPKFDIMEGERIGAPA